MKSLNIAYFLSVKSDYIGGADQTLFMQAVLMNAYHNVIIVLPCDENGKTNSIIHKKCEKYNLCCEVLFYNTANSMKIIDLVTYRDERIGIEKFVLQNNIDILHSVQINPSIEYISRKYGIPHVMNIYSLQDWEWNIPFADIFARYVSCDSEFYMKKWKAYLNCRGRCVRVFTNTCAKKSGLKKKNRIVFGTAGTLCTYKNQLEVIKAIEKEIKNGHDIELLFAGSDELPYAKECKNYIEEHNLQKHVQLLGFIEDMSLFFEKIDVLICGSMRESFPASIVEAFTCNIPVISTPVAGVPEILIDGYNAYISKGYSAEKLADAIESFFYDYERSNLDALLINQLNTYKQYFSDRAVKRQLEELYKDMLESMSEKGSMGKWHDIEQNITQMSSYLKDKLSDENDLRRIYSRLLYFYRIKNEIHAGQCYIWGAGKWGKLTRIILQSFLSETHIQAFIDSNKEGLYDGIDIVKKEEINLQRDTAVFISFGEGQEEAIEYLQKRGMEIMKNLFILV